MGNYVFNIAKELMAKGDIRMDDPEVDLNSVTNQADTTHAGLGVGIGKYRVMLITTGSSLVLSTTANGALQAIDVPTVDAITTLNELSITGYDNLAAGGESDGILGSLTVTAVVGSSGASYVKWDAADTTFNNISASATIGGLLIIWSKATPTGSNNTLQIPLVWIDLTGTTITTNGGDIEIVWASDGIARLNA